MMVAGSRVELLVRCTGSVGATYVLSANSSLPYSSTNFANNGLYFRQDKLATIKLVRGSKNAILSQPLVDEACTPRRAGYAADLRDANLLANNYSLSSIFAESVAFSGTNLTSSCGVRYNDGPNMLFTPDAEPILMPLGRVVQWAFTNAVAHPGACCCVVVACVVATAAAVVVVVVVVAPARLFAHALCASTLTIKHTKNSAHPRQPVHD